jgi:hypothetical protein
MSDRRKECWDTFGVTGLDPVLVTAKNLADWVVPSHPLHEAYEYLSPVHRADYLRGYLMLNHGGGYADIKQQTGSWLAAASRVNASSHLIGAGYREIRGATQWLQHRVVDGSTFVLKWRAPRAVASLTTHAMRATRPLLIGNGAYYFRPNSVFVRLWVRETERRLDLLLPKLRQFPPSHERDRAGSGSGYPVPWTFLLCDVFHPLAMLFFPFLSRSLPTPSFTDYM